MHRDGPRPNLFIIGSAKSGTTSLHRYLSSHPDVFMCEPKEPGFFVPEVKYYPKDEAWYRGLFAAAGDARIVGESSTHYAKLPVYRGVPERIAAYSPDARFIYLMRDPVERVISQYWFLVKELSEHRTMMQAIRQDPEYIGISDYRMQLAAYAGLFGRDRILVLGFEEMVRDPRATLETVFEWLGVDPRLGTREFSRENARPDEMMRSRAGGVLRRFATSRLWERLAPSVPTPVKSVGKRLSVKPVQPTRESAEEAIRYLRPILADKARELELYLGREFPDWTTVFPERARVPASAAV